MSDDQSGASSAPVEASAPQASPSTNPVTPGKDGSVLKASVCDQPATRCFVCELRELAALTAETEEATLGSAAELTYNIVGIRRKNSISDKFDDFIAVYTKLATGDNVALIEKYIEKDYLEDWAALFAKAKDKFRLAPCSKTKDGGVYAVGLFDKVSTDPGLTEDQVEKLEHEVAKSQKAIADREAAIEKKNGEIAALSAKVDKMKADLDKLPEDPPAKKGAKARAVGPRGKALQTHADAQITLGKQKEAVKKLEDQQKQAKTDLETTKGKLTESRKTREKYSIIGEGEEGGIEIGRAQVPCGVHTNAYAIGIHHGGKATTLPKGHTAFVCEVSPKGYRYFSADYFLSHGLKDLPRKVEEVDGKLSIVRRVVKGELDAKVLDAGALLVEKTAAPRTLEIVTGKEKLPVASGDTLVMRSQVDGCNLHRGHNAVYDEQAHKVVPGRPGGDRVKGFSEGCQVFQEFDAFNAFLRLGQVTKRFTCVKAHKDKEKDAACGRLTRGSGGQLSRGELAIEKRYGKAAIRSLELDHVKGDRKEYEDLKKRLEKKKTAWTQPKATELATLGAKAEPTADDKAKLKKLEAEAWTTDDEAELTLAQTRLGELDQEKALLDAESKAEAAKQTNDAAERAVERIEADNEKKKEKKLPADELEKKNQKAYDARKKAKSELDAANKKVDEHKKLVVESNHFLRERCGFFGADYLRECDVSGTCPMQFTYTLVEAADATSDDLVKRFKRATNVEWDGSLSLKKS